MVFSKTVTDALLEKIRNGSSMTMGEKLNLIVQLSIPSILAQVTTVMMFYIDASMVGSLGATASASIGLVEPATWLFGSLVAAGGMGFSVQAAHFIGANDFEKARAVMRHGYIFGLAFSLVLMAVAALLATPLPRWLGGGADIQHDASIYFLIFSFAVPVHLVEYLSAAMLKVSGDMRHPSLISVLMCVMDVVFNFILIFPTRPLTVLGFQFEMFGFGLGVKGAAIGTLLSFAVTAESLCYMPGYGIAEAATTLVGQSVGAKRKELCKSFAYMTIFIGMAVMAFMGVVMYIFAPEMIGMLSPVPEIRELGVAVLRIEAFAEPFFAAAIVAYSVCVGAGDTFKPSLINLGSMWFVRLTLAYALASTYGLRGVWFAMAVELTFRGSMFLIRIYRGGWLRNIADIPQTERATVS